MAKGLIKYSWRANLMKINQHKRSHRVRDSTHTTSRRCDDAMLRQPAEYYMHDESHAPHRTVRSKRSPPSPPPYIFGRQRATTDDTDFNATMPLSDLCSMTRMVCVCVCVLFSTLSLSLHLRYDNQPASQHNRCTSFRPPASVRSANVIVCVDIEQLRTQRSYTLYRKR